MDGPPPPPPPHGENPKSTSSLPPGKYDIFIIPPHSSGSGFLYLPSLKPNVNSFAAGFASALILVALYIAILPAVQLWFSSIKNSGGAGMMLVSVGLAIGAWAVGRMQNEGGFSGKSSGNGQGDASAGAPPRGPPPHGGTAGGGQNGYTPGGGAHSRTQSHGAGYTGGGEGPSSSGNGYAGGPGGWDQNTPPPKPNGWQHRDETPPQPRPKPERSQPSGWERAREETRRKEEERKRAAELQRQKEEAERKLRAEKEEAERRLKEAREKEQREREAREAARERIAREAREARAARDAKLAAEKKAKEEAAAKAQREKEEAAKKAAEAEAKAKAEFEEKRAKAWAAAKIQAAIIEEKKKKEAEAAEAAERQKGGKASAAAGTTDRRQGSSYAYSAMGEKTNPWPRGYPTAPASVSATTTATPRAPPGSAAAAAAARTPSPTKRSEPSSSTRPTPSPNVKSTTGTENLHSYRPYDTPPKRPTHSKSPSSIYSGTSYAESDTTSATSAPPSMRGPYSTKDPDKIVLKAVYSFNNAHIRTPVTQLVSGTGSVTDGLILRITTEGLFIDDDVRHVPQREWDIKAWTLKLVEVGCPCFPNGFGKAPKPKDDKLFGNNSKNALENGWQGEDAEKKVAEFFKACKENCRLGLAPNPSLGAGSKSRGNQADYRSSQTGQSGKLHVLRASIRDQEGKKYVFVIGQEEGWKIAVGIQRLRGGSLARSLGVNGMGKSDCTSTLTNLGWA